MIKSPWALRFGKIGFRWYCWRNNISLTVTEKDNTDTERLAKRFGWGSTKENLE